MTIRQLESGFGMNYQEKSLTYTEKNKVEKIPIFTDEIIDYRKLSNEEAKNLYYAYKQNDLMKSKIETYIDIEEKELEYDDIREVKKYQNRNDLIDYYKEEVKIQNNELKHEVWA